MARWFRRPHPEPEKPGEDQEAPRDTGSEPGPPEAAAGPAVSADLPGSREDAPPLETEARRGFFSRFRRERTPEEVPPSHPEPEAEMPPEEVIPPPAPSAETFENMDAPVGAGLPRPYQEFPPPETAEEVEPFLSYEEIPATEAAQEEKEAAGAEEEEAAEPLEPRKGLFRRFRERLSRTREALSGGLDRLLLGRKQVDAALLDELEELLITADLGVETTRFLIQALQEKLKRRELGDVERLKAALQEEMASLVQAPPAPAVTSRPWVTLLVGVNGVGKTTTIAKLAHRDRLQGLTSLLVAGDTFRAAAVEQLEIWGQRVGAQVIQQKPGSDPAAVVFDGLAAAQARGVDTVYIDTAGRLHTKVNLMEELKKMQRTAAKQIPGAPHEVLLILDATTGQNALSQVRLFHEAVGVTGIIITKMDGTAKGGVALAIAHETGVPLRYLGVGEALEDLRPFDAQAFVQAILG